MKRIPEEKAPASGAPEQVGVSFCDDRAMIPNIRFLRKGERIEFPDLGVRNVFFYGTGVKIAEFPDGSKSVVIPHPDVLERIKTYVFAELTVCENVELDPQELRFLRKRVGMTQQAMADRLGQSRENYNAFENGRSPISRALTLAVQRLCLPAMVTSLNSLPDEIRRLNHAAMQRIQDTLTMGHSERFKESNRMEVSVECSCLQSA